MKILKAQCRVLIVALLFTLKSCLQPSQVKIISRGEMYNNNSDNQYYEDNITVFNLNQFSIPVNNFCLTVTGWIQTGSDSKLNNYESKVQIFDKAKPESKVLFFGNNSTHFLLRQDISNKQSTSACELNKVLNTNYRFVISINQSPASGVQFSLTLVLPNGTILSCKNSSQNQLPLNGKTLLLAVQVQRPVDLQKYLPSTEKMGGITLISNYFYVRDATSSNLNLERFLLNFNPAGLQLFYFQFAYEQRDCNCVIDASENKIQGKFSKQFGVLETAGAGGYFIYSFTSNQELSFAKSAVRFGQPMDNFYNSLNTKKVSDSYAFMSLLLSFWVSFDSNVQSFQIFSYSNNSNIQLLVKIKNNGSVFKLSVFLNSVEYTLSSSLNANTFYHCAISITTSYVDLYINGSFASKTQINLLTLFQSETASGTLKFGGENVPTSSVGKLSQTKMFSSTALLTSQPTVTDSLILNCLSLVQVKGTYICILCKSGFYLNNQNQCLSTCNSSIENKIDFVRYCSQKCSYRCKTCSTSDPLTCDSCSSSRYLKGSTCLCTSGTFEDYKSQSCKSTKRFTKGYEIGQFTFHSESQLQIFFKNAFSVQPKVIFSVLGVSSFDTLTQTIDRFDVQGSNISTTSMTVAPGISICLNVFGGCPFSIHVQYFAYEPSDRFYSDSFSNTQVITGTTFRISTLGAYYDQKNPSEYNVHIFLGGYRCNIAQIFSCKLSIQLQPDKRSVSVFMDLVGVAYGRVYYLVTPPEIASFSQTLTFQSPSTMQSSSIEEKYLLSKIPLSVLSDPSEGLVTLDALYSINEIDMQKTSFKYFKYQPNEMTFDSSSGQMYQNYELLFGTPTLSLTTVQATIMLESFYDNDCGVKDYYTLNCLYCINFGFDPSTGCTLCLPTFQKSSDKCITPDGKYYDAETNSNLDCDVSCSLCDSKDKCTQCKGPLTSNSQGLCSCSIQNQWFDSNGNCSPCQNSCQTCTNNSSCSSCYPNMNQNAVTQLCECTSGYWLNSVTSLCSQCFMTCASCTNEKTSLSQNCSNCNAGRVLNGNGDCICSSADPRIYSDDLRCSQDSQAILNIILSNDYLTVTIDFGINIQPLFAYTTKSSAVCSSLFNSQTQTSLGSGASCEISNQLITISLDGTARILQGDLISFQSGTLKFQYNQNTILQFFRNKVNMVGLPVQSSIVLNQVQLLQNYCSKQTLSVKSIINDGKRGIKQLKWSSNASPIDNLAIQNLKQFIDSANISQLQSLLVFLPMVSQDLSLTIKLDWNLWVGQSGTETITILIQKKKNLRINHSYITSPPFFVYKNIELLHSISCELCDASGKIQVVQEPLKVQIKNTLLGIDTSLSGYTKNSIKTLIGAFSMNSDKTYQISATFTVESDPTITFSENVELYIKPSDLVVRILGGSRYASYKNAFNIAGYFKDFEIQNNSPTIDQGITLSWSCTNIQTSQPCVDSKNKVITLSQGVEKQSIKEYTFDPYSVVQIQVNGSKTQAVGSTTHTRTGTDSIIVFVTEMDIPPLEVIIPEGLIIDPTINPNQLIHAELVYDSAVSVDSLFYSGTIIYQHNVVGVIKFDYTKIRFQVWDYFDGFDPTDLEVQVRFSVYNPQYVLPSLTTIPFKLNFPPINCQLNAQQFSQYSLDQPFQLSYDGCTDSDSSISYQFFYYNDENDYQLEKKNYLQIKRKQLNDISLDNTLTTNLPGGKILILAQAIDSRGAITNSTQTIDIKLRDYTPSQYLTFVDSYIASIQSMTPELYISNLSMLCDDLIQRDNSMLQIQPQIHSIKQRLLQELEQSSNQIFSTSFFYQLSQQSTSKLLSSMTNLQKSDQQSQIQLIQNNLSAIEQRCVSSQVSQTGYEKCVQDIYLSFNLLDSLSQSSSGDDLTLNQQYISITNYISRMLNKNAIPNENAILFSGNNLIVQSQKITQKYIYYYTGINEDTTNKKKRILTNQQNSTNNSNQSADSIQQPTIYDVTYKTFNKNFYKEEDSFKNLTNKIQNATQKSAVLFPVISPSIVESDSQKQYHPKNGAIHYFQESNEKKNLTCVAQSTQQNWSPLTCSTRKNEKTKQIQCICPDLSPTSILEDIGDLFNTKQINTAFGKDGLSNLANFTDFYKYWVFWIILGQTILFLVMIFYGMRLDAQFLYDSIPLPLRKGSPTKGSDLTKIMPIQQNPSNTTKFKKISLQQLPSKSLHQNSQQTTNFITTFPIIEEEEGNGIENSPEKPKKVQPEIVEQLNLDVMVTERDQELNINSNDSNIVSNKNLRFEQVSSATHIHQYKQPTTMKRKRKIKSLFDSQLSVFSENLVNPTPTLQKDTSIEKISSEQTKQLKYTSKSSNQSLQVLQIPKNINFNEDYAITPLSLQQDKLKIISSSTLPDIQHIIESDSSSKQDTNSPVKIPPVPKSSQFVRGNKRQKQIQVESSITDTEKVKLFQINKIKYYAFFHEFISIFLVFRYEISRAVRFVIFYVRYLHTLAISVLFASQRSFIQTIFLSIASSIFILVITLIIENLLTSRKFLRRVGVIITILIGAFYAYLILAVVSGEKPESSNKFIWTYLTFLATDILVIQSLTALIFGVLAKSVVSTKAASEKLGCFEKIFNILKLNIIVSALLK